jgi:hypothetical protein
MTRQTSSCRSLSARMKIHWSTKTKRRWTKH